MPVMILIVAFALFGERPRAQQIAGVVLSLAGVVFIASRGMPEALLSLQSNPGDLWIMGAMIAYAIYSALLRKKPQVHPLSMLAVLFVTGALLLLPFYLREHFSGNVLHPHASTFAALAYLVIFPSFLSYLCFNRAVEMIGAARAGPFINLMPVFGSILAVIFLGERIEVYHLIGAALIGGGLLISSMRRRSHG